MFFSAAILFNNRNSAPNAFGGDLRFGNDWTRAKVVAMGEALTLFRLDFASGHASAFRSIKRANPCHVSLASYVQAQRFLLATMSTIEETKMYFPISAPVGSTAVANDVSLFIAPPPVEIKAEAEAVIEWALPADVDLSALQTLSDEDCLALSADIEPDWTGPDGLMTALLGESPKLSGLELSLNEGLFFAANQNTAMFLFPVPYLGDFWSILGLR
jgi:hypothetical protein